MVIPNEFEGVLDAEARIGKDFEVVRVYQCSLRQFSHNGFTLSFMRVEWSGHERILLTHWDDGIGRCAGFILNPRK